MSNQLGEERDFTGTMIEFNKETQRGRFRCTDGFEFEFLTSSTVDQNEVVALFATPGPVSLGARQLLGNCAPKS